MTRNSLRAGVFVVTMMALGRDAQAGYDRIYPVTATASNQTSSTPNAYDGQPSTIWNSNGYPIQWIQFDFGRPIALSKFRLLPAQYPSGTITLRFEAGLDPSNLHLVGEVQANGVDNTWLNYACDTALQCGNTRYFRVTTVAGPSWVAWRDMEFYQPLKYFGYFGDVFDWVGTGNYMSETIAAGANVVWISSKTTSRNFSTLIFNAKGRGAKVILDITNLVMVPYTGELKPTWESVWTEIVSAIQIGGQERVIAIAAITDSRIVGMNDAHKIQLINRIKADFPSIPVLGVYPSWAFTQDYPKPTGQGDKLFDWYGIAGGEELGTALFYLRRFKPAAPKILVPTISHGGSVSTTEAKNQAIQNVNDWSLSLNTAMDIAGFFPSQWQTGDVMAGPYVGIRDWALKKERMKQFVATHLQWEKSSRLYPLDVTASATYSGRHPFEAFDSDPTTAWNSGGGAPATLTANLSQSTRITKIDLTISQYPNGLSSHRVMGLGNSGWITLASFGGQTTNGQTISWTGIADVSQIRVETLESNSWVAWQDIAIYR